MLSIVRNEPNNENNGMEVTVLPDPPEFMSYEAKCEFLRSIGLLVESDLYKGPAIGIFESYCIATGFARECEQRLAEDGMIVGGKPHPAYKMMLDAMTNARASWESLKPKKIIIKEDEEEESWGKDKGLLA